MFWFRSSPTPTRPMDCGCGRPRTICESPPPLPSNARKTWPPPVPEERSNEGLARVAAGDSPAKSRGSAFSGLCSITGFDVARHTGCGYHTAGHAVLPDKRPDHCHSRLRQSRRRLTRSSRRLTAAVVQEMVTRTHYHILNEAERFRRCDAARYRAISTSTSPLTYDSQTGRASSALVVVTVKVTLTDSHGKVLYENPSYLFRERVSGLARTLQFL